MKGDSKEISRSLVEYGFSENEAAIYLFLLKNLEASVFEIAKETNIPRTTVYKTLESIKKQGFVSQLRKNNVAYFTPESPNRLMHLLKRKKEIVGELLPQIQAISSRAIDAPIAKLYTGLDGIKTGLEDILETLKDTGGRQIFATSQPDLLKYLPRYFPSWLKIREDMGVFTKLILPQGAKDYLETNDLREVRYLPEDFPFDSSVTIYGNKIAFFYVQKEDSYCVILESRSITEMFKQFFLFSWEMLGKNRGGILTPSG